MGKLRPWLVRIGLVLLGAVVCSLVLEQATLLMIWGFVDNPHDVGTIFHQFLVSSYGSFLGGATVIAVLLARHHYYKIAGALTLFFSGIGVAWAVWTLYHAEELYDPSKQPLNDALAYSGPTLSFSLCVFIWGLLLSGKRYQAPLPPEKYEPAKIKSHTSHLLGLIGLAITGIVSGIVTGALTNFINGRISPLYFANIMGLKNSDAVWGMAITQGIFEGVVFGILLSLIFTSVVGIVSRASCPYRLGLRYLLTILLVALGGWVLGGLFAMGLATLSPEFYRGAFYKVPLASGEMMRYAWVGGSIIGLQLFAFLAVIVVTIIFRSDWHKRNLC